MKCVKCGNALEPGARFCGSCGTQQPGAVIPQASVRTNAKTMFQGSGSGPIVVGTPPAATPPPGAATPQAKPTPAAAPAKPAQPAVPDKRGPVSSAMSFAATMAPGAVEMAPLKPQPAAAPPRSATAPLSQLPAPPADGDLTGRLLNNRYLIEGNVRREKRKEKVDQMAAAILLQSFLDSRPS